MIEKPPKAVFALDRTDIALLRRMRRCGACRHGAVDHADDVGCRACDCIAWRPPDTSFKQEAR